jgi:hypothetical protein
MRARAFLIGGTIALLLSSAVQLSQFVIAAKAANHLLS